MRRVSTKGKHKWLLNRNRLAGFLWFLMFFLLFDVTSGDPVGTLSESSSLFRYARDVSDRFQGSADGITKHIVVRSAGNFFFFFIFVQPVIEYTPLPLDKAFENLILNFFVSFFKNFLWKFVTSFNFFCLFSRVTFWSKNITFLMKKCCFGYF